MPTSVQSSSTNLVLQPPTPSLEQTHPHPKSTHSSSDSTDTSTEFKKALKRAGRHQTPVETRPDAKPAQKSKTQTVDSKPRQQGGNRRENPQGKNKPPSKVRSQQDQEPAASRPVDEVVQNTTPHLPKRRTHTEAHPPDAKAQNPPIAPVSQPAQPVKQPAPAHLRREGQAQVEAINTRGEKKTGEAPKETRDIAPDSISLDAGTPQADATQPEATPATRSAVPDSKGEAKISPTADTLEDATADVAAPKNADLTTGSIDLFEGLTPDADVTPQKSAAHAADLPTNDPVNFAQALPEAKTPSTSAPAPALPAPAPEARFATVNHESIVSSVSTQLLPDGGSMKIRLDPPELGDLQISVHMRNGMMTADFQTSNDQATRLLSHSLAGLKSMLEAQGVVVDKLHVQQGPRSNTGDSSGSREEGRQDPTAEQRQSQQREQQRKQMIQKMWDKLAGKAPVDLVA